MNSLLIFKIWRHKLPALWAILTMALVFLWPSVPLRGISNWLQFLYYYSPQNYFYAILSILSGIYVGIYVYDRKVQSCCSIQNKKAGAAGSVLGVLLGACPACIPVLAFLLPLSVSITLSRVSLLFLIIAIAIMLFSIYRMNGFRKV
jgi:hypothetical protein